MKTLVLVLMLTACGSSFEKGLFHGTDDAGEAGSDAGFGGAGGQAGHAGVGGTSSFGGTAGGAAAAGMGGGGGEAGAGGDAALECSPGTVRGSLGSGDFCIDAQPALVKVGQQGPSISFLSAVTSCESRGMRLCTQQERESSCPGGQEPSEGANNTFCSGPAGTWEWSATVCTSPGHCRTPCCNSVAYPCDTNVCDNVTADASYHCCKDLS